MSPDEVVRRGRSWLLENRWKIAVAVAIPILLIPIAFFVFPLLDGLVLGLVFAYVGRPIRNRLTRFPRLAAGIATLAIVLPIAFILGVGTIEAVNNLIWMVQNQQEIMASLAASLAALEIPPDISAQALEFTRNITQYLLPAIAQLPVIDITRGVAILVFNFIISIIVCYFLLLDGERFVEALVDILPRYKTDIANRFIVHTDIILSGIFIGNVYTAISVSLISLAVFTFFEIPHRLVLASLMFLAALIPILAGWMVIIPVTIYQYLNLGITEAIIFLAVSTITIYAPPEILIRPYIVSKRANMHPLVVLVAFIGGGLVAGIKGFFIAPILVGMIFAAYRVYIETRGMGSTEGIY